MRLRIGRFGAMLRLLLAIFADLRRRAWWAYRTGGAHLHVPRTSIVSRRSHAEQVAVPRVTAAWRPLAARAIPVYAAATMPTTHNDLLPIMWIDCSDRLDIADLPRVLYAEQDHDPPIVVTQWLADPPAQSVVLVVTFVEPVECTFALRVDLQPWSSVLEHVVFGGQLYIALDQSPRQEELDTALAFAWSTPLPQGLLVPIATTAQLRAILSQLAEDRSGW